MTLRLFLRSLGLLALAAALLVWLGRHTDLDLRLADAMFDFPAQRFPWRGDWFASVVLHKWMKQVFIVLGLIPLALLAHDMLRRQRRLDPAQRALLVAIAGCFLLETLAVAVLKSFSIHACPWDLQRYGGMLDYLRIFDTLPAGTRPGHCFPAGHASVAMWLPALAIPYLRNAPRKAGWIFFAALAPGLALGWVQQMRGAHFLTHTLWTAWIACLVVVCVARMHEVWLSRLAGLRKLSLQRV